MRTPLQLVPLLILLPVLLAGCGTTQPAAPVATSGTALLDQAEIVAVLSELPEIVEEARFEAADTTDVEDVATAADVEDVPLRFWRVITDVDRDFEFAFADPDSSGRPTTAVVTVRRLLTGRFNVLRGAGGDDGTADSLYVVHKPLIDRWLRRVLLKRTSVDDSSSGRWRVVATSGVRITARDATSRVLGLRIQTASSDTTIVDPLAFFYLPRILVLEPGTMVKLTLTTPRSDDVVVLYCGGHRLPFQNLGDGVYAVAWPVPDLRLECPPPTEQLPLFHLGVNVLSHGTLFDDAAPYDSQAWILPILLGPDRLADELP